MKLKFQELQIPAFFYDSDGQWRYRSNFLPVSQARPYDASLPVSLQFGYLGQHRIAGTHGSEAECVLLLWRLNHAHSPPKEARFVGGDSGAMALHAELEEVRLKANDIDSLELIACHRALVQARLRFLSSLLRDRYR